MTASFPAAGALRPRLRAPGMLLWPALAAALVAAAAAALALGRYAVPLDRVLAILASHIMPVEPVWTATDATVVEIVRAPRMMLAAFAGAGLALSGAALQGIFRNPLVGPQIIGVSSGAAAGGVLAMLLSLGGLWVVGGAFTGAVAALLLVLAAARVEGSTSILTLVLAGVVIGAFFGALTSLMVFMADPETKLPGMVFWLMGSFAAADWHKLAVLGAATVAGGSVLLALRWRINLLSLGDEDARSLGVPVEATRWLVLTAVCLIVAAQVSVSGSIGWVGLVMGHVARMLVGPDHRVVLPAAALLGASYMILVDTAARTLTGAEIPLGILTALIGAPLFAMMLRRTARRRAA